MYVYISIVYCFRIVPHNRDCNPEWSVALKSGKSDVFMARTRNSLFRVTVPSRFFWRLFSDSLYVGIKYLISYNLYSDTWLILHCWFSSVNPWRCFKTFCCFKIREQWWEWQSIPVFLPGKSHGQGNLMDYNPWGCKRVGHELETEQQGQLSTTEAGAGCARHPRMELKVGPFP